MAYTEADLAAVRAAILRGEKAVQFADRSVTYRSIEELQAVEQAILGELAADSSSTRSKQTRAVASKGF